MLECLSIYAIAVEQTGGPEVLSRVEQPRPSPVPGEVLIKAEAIGVNFVDTYFRSGVYPHEVPFILGAEVAGTIAAVGEGVTALRVGERVATADAVGAYAEYCVAPADVVAAVPDTVSSDVTAAAILNKSGYDGISVAAKPGVSSTRLAAEIKPLLPAVAQVRTGSQQASHDAGEITAGSNFIK